MKLIDITNRFKDNSHQVEKGIIWHWTASSTAKSAINWLDERNNGEGSVAYNYIIDKNGDVYMLGNPNYAWFHNSGLGSEYDKDIISISLVSMGREDLFTDEQIESSRQLYSILSEEYKITLNTHHASINEHKQDFPETLWVEFKEKITGK